MSDRTSPRWWAKATASPLSTKAQASRLSTRATAALVAAALPLGVLVAVSAMPSAAAETPPPTRSVTLTVSRSAAGFSHPGVGTSAASLVAAQTQLAAGREPWASYWKAMLLTKFAARDVTSANQGAGEGVPRNRAFDNVGVNYDFGTDATVAYTQALIYWFTGDVTYRRNALRLVRLWSHMDPTKYARFADSHIKVPYNLYAMVSAAELLRYTSVPSANPDLVWTAKDTADFSANLVVPTTDTFAYGNAWYYNQQTIPLQGALAGYIFTDNRARYDEGVEWFTVNQTHPNPEINGALAAMYRLVDRKNPYNTYGKTFVQHQEMGRDQAHAMDDNLTLTLLARIVNVQGTRLDPVTGKPSTARNAVSPYAFLDNRLLKGVDVYLRYMMGYDTPWVDLYGGSGHLSPWYRGRWSDPVNELYHIYKYDLGVNVEKVAPFVAKQYEQRDGATFYNFPSGELGTALDDNGLRSAWGGGGDYWLSFPVAATGLTLPKPVDNRLEFETKSQPMTDGIDTQTEAGRTFVRLKTDEEEARTVAVRSFVYGERNGYSPIGIMVRTNEIASLDIRPNLSSPAYQHVTVPDTNGQWRFISYDMDTAVVPLSAMGDNNIAYLTFTSQTGRDQKDARIDLDYISLRAQTELKPPRFAQGTQTTVLAVAGAPLSVNLAAQDGDGASTVKYALVRAAKQGPALDPATGRLTWTPTAKQIGDTVMYVQASDDQSTTALKVTVRVLASRQSALTAALAGYDDTVAYTSVSRAPLTAAVAKARSLLTDGSTAAFVAALADVQIAVKGLALLNPLYPDSTLAYDRMVASSLDAGLLGKLVDNDNLTFSGDLFTNNITLDFGADYRVAATSFDVQARITFGNRSQGSNVYGSNDGVLWTKLTTRMTTRTDDVENLPVAPALTTTAFRFIKLQVDEPGVATDPNFPGIFSVAEFKIHGVRSEAVNAIDTATIGSTSAMPGRAVNGDTVTVKFTSREAISDVAATIEGIPATLSGSGTSWSASAVLPQDVGFGRNVTFAINYTTAAGLTADPAMTTTDGSSLFLSNETTMLRNVVSNTQVVSLLGEREPSKDVHWGKMFDGDPASYSDVGPVNGSFYVVADLGEGGTAALTRAELLVRQDTWGTSRAPSLHLEGSNDLTTWNRITNNATGVLGWQTLPLSKPAAGPVPYRYLRVANTNWINIAELRLFGTYAAPAQSFISTATLTSSNALSNLAVPGDTVSLALTSSRPLANVAATIDGAAATVTGGGTRWTATWTVPAGVVTGRKLPFRLTYTDDTGTAGAPLTATTDASTVFVSDPTGLVPTVAAKVQVISTTGEPESSKAAQVAKLFDQKISTFSDIGPVNGQYYAVLDFGDGGTVTLDRVELLVRQDAFGTGRSGNLHLEGSNDLSTWTTLTGTAAGTLAWQKLPLTASPAAYRYLKVANTDWINVAELRLFGSYTAPPASLIAAASISSSNALGNLAVPGDTVTVRFTSREPLTTVAATVDGATATVSGGGTDWSATWTVPDGVAAERKVPFRVTYANAGGTAGPPLVATTDGSTVFLSRSSGLLTGLATRATPVDLTGQPEPAKATGVANLFDGKVTTFSDVGPVNGQYYIVLDLGQGGSAALSTVELLVRQDSFGTGRSANLKLQGSNDLSSWTDVTGNPSATLAWQSLPMAGGPTAYRYLRISNTDWINIAELRLFGTATAAA